MMSLSCKESHVHTLPDALSFQWKEAGTLPRNADGTPSAGLAGPVAGISNNVLLVGGGSNFAGGAPWQGGIKKYYRDIFVYKKENDSLVLVKQNLQLPYNVAYSANCSTTKGVVVAGGENAKGAIANVLLLNWNDAAQNISVEELPALPQTLSGGAIAADGDKIYFAGGQNMRTVSDKLYMLDLNDTAKGWQVIAQLPKPVAYSVLYIQSNGRDKCLYLVGGRKMNVDSTSDLYNNIYQFDLTTKQWAQKTSLPYALSAHSGVAFGRNELLVFSGDKGETFHKTEELLMQISKEKDSAKKHLLIAKKNKLQQNHPGFSHEVLAYNTVKDAWQKVDSIPFVCPVTTTALKWGDDIVIPCGEIRAGVRSANILLGTLKNK